MDNLAKKEFEAFEKKLQEDEKKKAK